MAHPHISEDEFDHKDPEAIHHIVTPKTYIAVYITLLICTGLTTGAAFIDLKAFNPVLALFIACFKAVIVILFFMHVYFSSRLMKLTVAAGFFTFVVLIMMTLSDYMSRSWGLW
jgi:cytochrome c oxidase subunit IV